MSLERACDPSGQQQIKAMCHHPPLKDAVELDDWFSPSRLAAGEFRFVRRGTRIYYLVREARAKQFRVIESQVVGGQPVHEVELALPQRRPCSGRQRDYRGVFRSRKTRTIAVVRTRICTEISRMPLKPLFVAAALFQCCCLIDAPSALAQDAETLRVMTFNLWQGGEEGKQPLEQSIKVIQAAKAEIVGLQETRGLERDGKRPDNAQRIAKVLGWHYFDQGDGTGVISRHKIVGHTPKKLGMRIELPIESTGLGIQRPFRPRAVSAVSVAEDPLWGRTFYRKSLRKRFSKRRSARASSRRTARRSEVRARRIDHHCDHRRLQRAVASRLDRTGVSRTPLPGSRAMAHNRRSHGRRLHRRLSRNEPRPAQAARIYLDAHHGGGRPQGSARPDRFCVCCRRHPGQYGRDRWRALRKRGCGRFALPIRSPGSGSRRYIAEVSELLPLQHEQRNCLAGERET